MARTRSDWKTALLLGLLGTAAVGATSASLVWASPARAEALADQEVSYTLFYQGKPAGTHTVKIRHYAAKTPGDPETRILESYEDIRGADIPEALWQRSRATARAKGQTLTFTVVTETGAPGSGRVTEVNGKRNFDGSWVLNTIRGPASETQELRRSQADLCTLDLLDPLLHEKLLDRPTVRMIDARTGAVLEGTVSDMGETAAEVAGQSMAVKRVGFDTAGHTWTWDWNLEGVLLQYDVRLGDGPLTARAESAPPLRTWGEVDASTRFDNGVPIMQDDL
jgi:hypothetical protein